MEKAADTPDFQQKVMAHGEKPVFLQFSAEWCGPCKMIEGDLAAMAEEFKDKVGFVYVEVDKLEEVAELYEVTDLPKFVILKNLKEEGSFQGNKVEKIRELIENSLK